MRHLKRLLCKLALWYLNWCLKAAEKNYRIALSFNDGFFAKEALESKADTRRKIHYFESKLKGEENHV